MSFIIIWRNSHRDPFVEVDYRGFRNFYDSYDNAKKSAEETFKIENEISPWYFDYQIYEEVIYNGGYGG